MGEFYSFTNYYLFLLDDRKATLFKEGSIDYQDVNLVADSISVDFQTRMLNANGLTDTNGAIYGRPKFKDGSSEYNANEITYNFNSRKGIIQGVITQEGEGFLHGSKVKKDARLGDVPQQRQVHHLQLRPSAFRP